MSKIPLSPKAQGERRKRLAELGSPAARGDLTDFLLARIAYDEALQPAYPPMRDHPHARRALAECEAKRRIVGDARDVLDPPFGRFGRRFVRFWLAPQVTQTLRFLALPYADHPDYREEWKP